MNETTIKKDLLSQLLYESQAYKKFEDIEKLVEAGMDLSMVPVQPLYVSLQATSKEHVAAILPKLSEEQRQALRDIDLWKKDTIDPVAASYWMEVMSLCPDEEVVLEYLKSEDFLLSFKSQFGIATFDVEDPMYPDDDNYFLTEDGLLLIQYPENFAHVQELKEAIRRLYGDMGVEHAYAFLFKMVVDSYQTMEETAYSEKVERLRDFGFVDYFDALALNAPFHTKAQIDSFIQNKKALTGKLEILSVNQALHASSLTPYQQGLGRLKDALNGVQDEKRQQFLHFNFVRLVNSRMTMEDAFKNGSTVMTKVGQQTRQRLDLGFDYIVSLVEKESTVFEKFDFIDIYKVGHSLIELTKKNIKKALSSTPFEKEDFEYFLGMYWNAFLDNSEEEVTKYKFDGSSQPLEVKDLESYQLWNQAAESFVTALPFINTFFKSLENLKGNGLLNDQFYLNYEVENIDFEAIMISSFINFVGGHYEEDSAGKMGVTIAELKNFYHLFFLKKESEYLIKGEEDPILREKVAFFIKQFGLTQIPYFERYMYQIMLEQLNGYEVDNMTEEDFQHVGGPILLNFARN